MRITRESLHTIARDTAEKYARRNRGLACIYLTGSLLSESPLLGGTTDIDLVFVHTSTPPLEREIIHLTDEVHLDIAHFSQTVFHQPRRLRINPWVGSNLCLNSLSLFETQHWFEFTQASAGAQFNQPENVIGRARTLASASRSRWTDLHTQPDGVPLNRINKYLSALEDAANSIAVITGTPLTERRFITLFPDRARAVSRPGLAGGLTDLFAPDGLTTTDLSPWFEPWKDILRTVGPMENVPPRLAPTRLYYYERAAAALNEENPAAALWLILRTWTRAVEFINPSADLVSSWKEFTQAFELDESHFDNRVKSLDTYLDAVEETLDDWAQNHGV